MSERTFDQNCVEASGRLRLLSRFVPKLEELVVALGERCDDLTVCTDAVKALLEIKKVSEQLAFTYIPYIREEDESVGYAIQLAYDELVRRALNAEQDLNSALRMIRSPGTPTRFRPRLIA